MDALIKCVKMAMSNAENNISKCNSEILSMNGMSGSKTRHFYNNLPTLEDSRYLEIGTWAGSTVCAAMRGNSAKVVCIDNWSQFGGPKQEFLNNFNKFKGNNDASFIENDCFKIDVSTLPKFNMYLYDGDHSFESHYKALTYFIDCLDDTFIFVVDDWNWEGIRLATKKAIADLNLKVCYDVEVRTTNDDSHPVLGSPLQLIWHNGMYACVLQKPTQTPV
jgi:hypothetical protein